MPEVTVHTQDEAFMILVTGGTGGIGSELLRSLSKAGVGARTLTAPAQHPATLWHHVDCRRSVKTRNTDDETTSMKAFILDRYGSADRVRAGDMPDPELREDDVLVQIHAAGVNVLDSKIRNGEFKLFLRYRLPFILGHDVAGVVVRVGSQCVDSSPATKSMRGRLTGESAGSRNSSRSKKTTWR